MLAYIPYMDPMEYWMVKITLVSGVFRNKKSNDSGTSGEPGGVLPDYTVGGSCWFIIPMKDRNNMK